MTYNDLDIHLVMLQDRIRTEGYKRAIEAVVKPGDRVLDFGCGTGILSFFAARAGASVVYAVDRSPMIRTAQELARLNGIPNIRFFKGEGGAVELPSRVDVIVSEFMGHFVFHEQMLPPLLGLRDRWLSDSGAIIPSRDGRVHALCSWFDTRLAGDVGFGTGPWDPPTPWAQIVFPLVRPFQARAGRPIRISFSPMY
jgi:predicted RNA methylase